jgi:regulator of sigma E protease
VSLVWFIVLVGVLITVHELGHLAAAKALDIRVLKLSIGFGPKLVSFTRRGTEYAISIIPLGGYVRLLGEDRGDEVPEAEKPRAFHLRPAWQRMIVILAGPAANLIFPILIFAQLYAHTESARSATVGAVLPGQPAEGADLRPGDKIVDIDGEPVRTWDELNRRVLAAPGRELRVTVERTGSDKPLTKIVTPRVHVRVDAFGEREQVGLLGIAPHYRLPQIGVLDDKTPAYQAGLRTFDVITSIQGRPVQVGPDLEPLVHPRSGSMLVVTYLRPKQSSLGFAQVAPLEPGSAVVVPRVLRPFDKLRAQDDRSGRYDTGARRADLFIHTVEPGTPAASLGGIGLRPGDVLTQLDSTQLSSWEAFQQQLDEHPEDEHTLLWRGNDGVEHQGRFKLQPRTELDEYQAEATSWVFGAEGARAITQVPDVKVETHVGGAFVNAVGRAFGVTGTLVRVLGLTLAGRLPPTAIGGPILIYQVAGVAAQHGVEQFLVMAALVSLNLGLLNLLPVPLLDGGQASLLMLEAVRRRPVSARMRQRAAYVGVALLVFLLLLASRNDLLRHLR